MENVLTNKQKRSIERSKTLFVVYMMLTITAYTLPMLKITLPYIAVAILLLSSIFFLALKNAKWLYYILILCLSTLIVITIGMLTGVYGLVDAFNELVRNVRFFLPFLWGSFVLKYCHKKHYKFILVSFGLLCLVILFQTLIALREVPDICRELAKSTTRDSATLSNYRRKNVGGFEYSYMMGIVTLGFLWTMLKTSKKSVKVLCAVATIVCYYFIIQTMYTLLLILTFVGTVAIFFFSTKNKFIKILLVIGVILMFVLVEPMFKFLSEIFSFNYGLHEKFTNMYLALSYGDVDMVGSRPEMLLKGLSNWMRHPVFGGKAEASNTHSFIVSYLENSGIIGVGVWLGFFAYNWTQLRKRLHHKSLFDATMIYMFLLALFNPISFVFEIVFVSYLIIPVWSEFVDLKLREKDEEF